MPSIIAFAHWLMAELRCGLGLHPRLLQRRPLIETTTAAAGPAMQQLATSAFIRWRGLLESHLNRDHGISAHQLDHTTDFYIALYNQHLTPKQAAYVAYRTSTVHRDHDE